MQQGQPAHFTCNACGHSFAASYEVVSKQPTCPRCRTFGQLVDARGNPVGGRQNVVRVQHPGAGRPSPYQAQGGPVGHAGEEDYVTVGADVAYGGKDKGSVVKVIVLIVLGLGIVATLGFIVNVLNNPSARKEEARQQREVVLDPKEFEKAVDDSVSKVKTLLAKVPESEVQETTNFDEAMTAIQATGGVPPTWDAPPAPGKPFAMHGFLVKSKDPRTGLQVVGFVMLLYYKTAKEVEDAKAVVDRYLKGDTRNYGIYSSSPMWYLSYSGVNYKGELKDALDRAMRLGPPAGYKQFTDRVGSTMRDDLKN